VLRGPLKAILSDGGHLENLGVYELLRRRCKFIISSDAGEDADLNFSSLAKVIRYARIDQLTDIDIDVSPIRFKEKRNRLSERRWVLGKIKYPKKQFGYLLYIKSSLGCDDKDETVKGYSRKNPKFPHEPTTDQSFTEEQFESYRRLGQTIAEEFLKHSKSKVDGISIEEHPKDKWLSNETKASQLCNALDSYQRAKKEGSPEMAK